MQDGNVDLRVVDQNNSHFRFLITTTSHSDGFAQTQVQPLFFTSKNVRYGLVVLMTDNSIIVFSTSFLFWLLWTGGTGGSLTSIHFIYKSTWPPS